MSEEIVIDTDDVTRQMCPHSITDTARWELLNENGEMKVHEIYGITSTFKKKYELDISTGFDDYLDMVEAVANDDMYSAHLACHKIQHEVVDIKIPYEAMDNVKRDVSVLESSLLNKVNMYKLAERVGKPLALLNPSTGTISRFARAGVHVPIVTCGLDADYITALETRAGSEGYHGKFLPPKYRWSDVKNTHFYYCGMSTDNAYRNYVKDFIGFALDPYAHLSAGRDFTSSLIMSAKTDKDPDMYFEYVRDSYVSKLYYYKDVECYRYAVDAVGFYLENSEYVRQRKIKVNNCWNIMSTIELEIPPIRIANYDPPTVDVRRYNVVSIKEKKMGKYTYYVGEENGIKVVVDVLSPETRDRRDTILKELKGYGIAAAVDGGNYTCERFPSLAALVQVKEDIVEVAKSDVYTSAQSYESHGRMIDPRVIRIGERVVLRDDVEVVQACHVTKVGQRTFISYSPMSDNLVLVEGKGGKAYDFHHQKFVNRQRQPHKENFELLSRLKLQDSPKVPVVLRGYHPRFGMPSSVPEFYDQYGNGYYQRKGGGTFLVRSEAGTIRHAASDVNYMIHYDRSMKVVLSLEGYASRDKTINRSTYMMMDGKMTVIGKFGEAVDLGEALFGTDTV